MAETTKSAFDAWKSSDDAARTAEAKLSAAWERHERFGEERPGDQLLGDVARLRAIASDRLSHVVNLMLSERPTA